jgi:hypothetical protein
VTEILAGGFPYHDILGYLFEEKADLVSVSEKFMELYRSYTDVEWRTAALSVVKTGELNNIASVSKSLLQKYRNNIAGLDLSQIQKYDTEQTPLFFDFLNFMENIADNDAELITLRDCLSSAVLFEDHTPSILDAFEIKRSCGLSCYIPGQHNSLDYLYQNMAWYKAAYGN